MNHTKGPWIVVRKPVTVCIQTHDGTYITENVRRLPEQDANARLIAAAPELLEALKKLLSWTETEYHSNSKIETEARDAIAKAEGQ